MSPLGMTKRDGDLLLLAFWLLAASPAGAQMLSGGTLTMPSHGFAAAGGTAMSGGALAASGSMGQTSGTMAAGGTFSLVSGFFAARPSARLDLDRLHAFPVPFRASSGHNRITFRGATTHTTIRIYTLSGWLVRTLDKHDSSTEDVVWSPVVNFDGQPIASGVYTYFAEGGGNARKFGKLMIIK